MAKKDVGLSTYYRRSAMAIRVVRFVVLLAFVIFAVYCIGYFSSNLTEDSLRAVVNSVYRSFDDLTPSEADIKIETDDSSAFSVMHNDLAVISDTRVSLYAFSGDKMLDYRHMYSNASFVSAGDYLLVYDSLGYEFALYNSVTKLFEGSFEYKIKSAAINDMGYFAVITSEKTYRSGVVVYAPVKDGYDEIFRFMSSDKYILGTAINSNASYLAVAGVFSRNGAYVTEISVYNLATGEKDCSVMLDDTIAVKLGFGENDGVIYCLTEGSLISFTRRLEQIGTFDFSRSSGKFYRQTDSTFLVAESNNLSGSSMRIKVCDYTGETIVNLETGEKILDAQYYDNRLYVLYKDRFSIYDCNNGVATLCGEKPLDIQYRAFEIDSYGRYILIGAKNAQRGTVENLILQQRT